MEENKEEQSEVIKKPPQTREGTLCTHGKPCEREVGESFWYNFLRGCAIKLLLRLITERSFKSILKSWHDIPKFGVVVGLFSGVFKLTRCLLNRHCQSMHPRLKAFISGVMCSFALQLATQGEQTVLKMLLYPRVIECVF